MPVIPLPDLNKEDRLATIAAQYRSLVASVDSAVVGLEVTLTFGVFADSEKVVDWGDTNSDTTSQATAAHTYAGAGTYTVVVTIGGEVVWTEDVTV